MLSDRSYMRDDPARASPPVLLWMLGLIAAGFILQNLFAVWFASRAPIDFGALSATGIKRGYAWTLLTYVFLHGGLFHLLLNSLGLYFLGRELLPLMSPERLVKLFLAGALGAGLLWLGVNFQRPGNVIGASGVVMAFLAVFASYHPRRPITLLLFFILPVTVQPIWVVAVLGGVDLLGFLFYELPSNRTLHGVAHSAHLGGLAAGWLFYRLALACDNDDAPLIEAPRWVRKKAAAGDLTSRINLSNPHPPASHGSAPHPASPTRDALRAEVDRILDKISQHGISSLTAEEKRVLEDARRQMSAR